MDAHQRRGRAAGAGVLVDVEGHGREEVSADIDLSRTVGWFTSLYPVRLDVGGVDVEEALGGGAALGRALKLIKEQLRAVPGNGLGYGLLRYLNPRTGSQLAGFAAAQIGKSPAWKRHGLSNPVRLLNDLYPIRCAVQKKNGN